MCPKPRVEQQVACSLPIDIQPRRLGPHQAPRLRGVPDPLSAISDDDDDDDDNLSADDDGRTEEMRRRRRRGHRDGCEEGCGSSSSCCTDSPLSASECAGTVEVRDLVHVHHLSCGDKPPSTTSTSIVGTSVSTTSLATSLHTGDECMGYGEMAFSLELVDENGRADEWTQRWRNLPSFSRCD